ncbi:C-terminal binding protein [Sediminivirga luteola]|uniref:D-isomer specific 2-hydroxyacid dehydrogenase family protein n=1 Tax=Sediminivirga luteola TaxID=1774748 RepID=A0A8J2TXE7_9MICO|nr:C-terminal binding protein [Sediminivirga luteola]GGA12057.1 D-isomer specific 2-hydroxyacid dehydrogenase family protein [Sediminivirga luteola]
MPKVVITDHEFPHLEAEEKAAAEAGAELVVDQVTDEASVIALTRGADVVMLCYAPITEAVLAGLNPGAVVIRYGIGYDTIDVEAATRLGVRVCNVPDYGAATVADHTVMLMLSVLRRVTEFDAAIRQAPDGWAVAARSASIPALSDITVGLVGTGQIGRLVAARVQAFGSRVVAHDPYADAGVLAGEGIRLAPLAEVLESADVLSLHAPLNASTHHLLDAEALRRTKPGTIVVNTARGGLMDTRAAAELVTEGHLGGLGLDVFETEPLEAGHPLRTAPRTLLTPHAAFYSERSLINLQQYAADEMKRACLGETLRCQVNR